MADLRECQLTCFLTRCSWPAANDLALAAAATAIDLEEDISAFTADFLTAAAQPEFTAVESDAIDLAFEQDISAFKAGFLTSCSVRSRSGQTAYQKEVETRFFHCYHE